MDKKNFGKYGGKVLRRFNAADKTFIPGAILTPEDVEPWPQANRVALHSAGKVDWYDAPADVAVKAKKEATTVDDVPKDDSKTQGDAAPPESGSTQADTPAKNVGSRRRAPASKPKTKK